ncbi:CHAP domain-containing protein [Aeromicrobium endophyticum]|uniref:CHAP domain-containing protein n=1 Tax=Aeromicrobium endophyticum TaxID=2292704 RepID=A0A371P8Z8_9ACTN|nr:CHAP domain-containing protein [Aeromicrobium endophyticum]
MAPAHAASTVLCTTYTGCSNQGYSHAGYASAKGTSYWGMYTGTNCTNYVAYRLITTNGLSTKRPAPGVGNARDWGTAMASVTNATPAVGAVAWWGKTGNHVAYIEKVVSSSEIWVSESNWSGAFDWRKITKSGGGWPDGIIHFTPPAPVSSTQPAIVGSPTVGAAVTASTGTWNPAPASFQYQWMLDGAPLTGATAKTYTPTPVTAYRNLTVQVSGIRTGSATVRAVSPPAVVAPGTLTASRRPVVTGTAKIGQRLSATGGTWSRTDVALTYQWFSGANSIAGATSATYAAQAADVGQPLTVRVTASRAGFTPATSTSASTASVAGGTLVRRSGPSVTGTPRVGAPLTASPGTWSPAATTTFQWYADGRAVAGATAQTFRPTARERRATITVRVTARRAGYTSATATSAATSAVGTGRIDVAKGPRIAGSPSAGAVLTIDPGTYSPANASVRYQWMRDGKAISGATSRTRKVSPGDVGRRLSATVTYKVSGYSARTVTTAAARRTRSAATLSVKATSPAAGRVALTIRVKGAGGVVPTGSVSVVDPAGRTRTAKLVKGRTVLTVTGQPTGRQTYRITYGGSSTVATGTKTKSATVR